jgi:hypothetical protein
MRRDFVWRCGSKGSIATAHLRVPQRVGFGTARGLSLRRAEGLAPKKGRVCGLKMRVRGRHRMAKTLRGFGRLSRLERRTLS